MAMEREASNTSHESAELIQLYEKLKEHHRVSMLINDGSDELAALSDDEQDKWCEDGLVVMRSISVVSAKNAHELNLKALATKMICEIHSDVNHQICKLDYAIREAGTYEAAALSLARDVLRSVA